jgi:hypothetical protein
VGRPRKENVERPPCPDGHAGRVLLNGYYGRSENYRRPRYKCYPSNGTKGHPFSLPLGRRQPTASHPHGPECQNCGHHLARHEGAETPRNFFYSAREIAELLVDLGQGTSLRKASAKLRREAARSGTDQFGNRSVSRHGQLAINYLTAFGPIITDGLLPKVWPRSVVLDGTPFLRRTTYDDGAPRQGGPIGFALYAAHGYTGGKGTGFLWRMDMRGGADHVEWEAFLRSLATDQAEPPDWVVADGSRAIRKAVAKVWPGATFYVCEGHLLRLGNKALAKDHMYTDHELAQLWREAQWTADNWARFVDALDASDAEHMKHWTAKNRALIEHQLAIRQAGKPRSTGALESGLERAKTAIGARHFVFRNAARLRVLLGLMTLSAREEDDARLYTELIRRAITANGGHPPASLHSLDDKVSPSIAAEAAAVEARLGPKRAAARKTSQRHEAREAVKRAERRAERHAREGRLAPVSPPAPTIDVEQMPLALDESEAGAE